MAQRGQKDLISRLADRGEEAIQRLGHAPGAERLVEVASSLRDRVDELQRRILGLDEIERRVAKLEGRLDELTGVKKASARKPAVRKTRSPARKTAGAAKKAAGS